MKKTRFEQFREHMQTKVPPQKSELIAMRMDEEFNKLCAGDDNIPEDFVKHAHNNIYPVISAYEALRRDGMEAQAAAELAGSSFLELMEIIAGTIRKAMKFPGLYRSMPWLWKTMMPKLFSPASGFRFKFYPTDKNQVKFDMTACPYHSLCKSLGYEELAPVFCATDDVCYGNMHPKLIWNRTKTIARGGDLCDFDLYIKK